MWCQLQPIQSRQHMQCGSQTDWSRCHVQHCPGSTTTGIRSSMQETHKTCTPPLHSRSSAHSGWLGIAQYTAPYPGPMLNVAPTLEQLEWTPHAARQDRAGIACSTVLDWLEQIPQVLDPACSKGQQARGWSWTCPRQGQHQGPGDVAPWARTSLQALSLTTLPQANYF